MLVLFETPAGYALFSVKNEGKLSDVNNLFHEFETPEKTAKMVKLKAFSKFENTAEALSAATAIVDGKLSKELRKFLKEEIVNKNLTDTLAVAETKLGGLIKEKLNIQCANDNAINELFRGIRGQLTNLITGLPESEMSAMVLGLSHSLSRYKLKFSPDKVDTMIIQAIALLDDLDKELNTYAMRVKEWYGWHFPEMAKVVVDNVAYAKTARAIGLRTGAAEADLSAILPEELEREVKELAEISMGTEISTEDVDNIGYLCDQIISISEYRTQLYDYLKNRMSAIAPNLTAMVGELVGARLIAHAGSLMNLAKHPASTVQILGAEKALFRALKTKHNTPKYGLIYHASLIGQAPQKLKGKISRVLAAKAALSIRVDALGDKDTTEIGTESRLKVEARLRTLEGKSRASLSGSGKGKATPQKYLPPQNAVPTYNAGVDFIPASSQSNGSSAQTTKKQKKDQTPDKKQKRKAEEAEVEAEVPAHTPEILEKKKKKKAKVAVGDE